MANFDGIAAAFKRAISARSLWCDFTELWTDEIEEFFLIWTQEITVGLFMAICLAGVIGVIAPQMVGMPNQDPDPLVLAIQHASDVELGVLTDRVKQVEKEQLIEARQISTLQANQEEDTWYRRFVIGLLGTLVIGVAGLFAKVRMGGGAGER